MPEVDSDKARRLRDEFRSGLHTLLAPDVFPIEIAHSLTRAERQGRVTVGEALRLWSGIMATPPAFARSHLLLPRAVAVASAMRVGVYDCLYVALAERRRCRLVTADDRLVNALRPHFPFLVALASLA